MLHYSLQYHHDSALLFARIAHQPWAMFLDSGQTLNAATGMPGSQYGRYDILVADPFMTFTSDEQQTVVHERERTYTSSEDPFAAGKIFVVLN